VERLEAQAPGYRALLTPSCTHALEVAALLLDPSPGDEVIMPSFTFVSTANAFVLRGAVPVFVDIEPETMNIDPRAVEAAVGPRTTAIVAMHYAGNACDMGALRAIADQHGLLLIEDAAQGMGATWHGRALGGLADIGCLSFHYTKNLQCGEGGALLVCDPARAARAEIVREKGTNRQRFLRGQVDKYTWVDLGSSYVLSELNCAILDVQLAAEEAITSARRESLARYRRGLGALPSDWRLLGDTPGAEANGHLVGLIAPSPFAADGMRQRLAERGIQATSHYVPLHSAPAGRRFGRFVGDDRHTTELSGRLVRLPIFHGLSSSQIDHVVTMVLDIAGGRP
jgi:dTDP-4-amino-4,6-dideoxygalactose transaminase